MQKLAANDEELGSRGSSGRRTAKKKRGNEAFEQKVHKVARLLSKARRAGIPARYEVGQEVLEAEKNPRRYGARSVPRLAKRLGVSRSTLYGHAAVVRTWRLDALERLAARTSEKTDLPLTWSHFMVLAEVADPARRRELTEKALADALTVGKLKTLIRGRQPAKALKLRSAESLGRLATRLTPLAEEYVNEAAVWADSLFARLDEATADDLSPALAESLRRAKAAHEKLLDSCRTNLVRLDAAVQKLESAERPRP